MKASRYNYSLEISNGSRLLFNFYSLALLSLNPVEARRAERILATPDAPIEDDGVHSLKDILVKHGFLIDDRADELAVLRMARLRSQASMDVLNLTIAPTLGCNFACVYCYEHKQPERMRPEVEQALAAFVERIAAEGAKISITWFGGEPLLELDLIDRLSGQFLESCRKHNVGYQASMITNGYLLDRITAQRLADLGVGEVQVTLDGPAPVHDTRRCLKSGGGSFMRIWENIQNACDILHIHVRMNVDQTNREHIYALLNMLKEAGLERKAGFYLGQVLPYTDACSDVEGQCLTNADFSRLGLEINLEMVQHGFQAYKTVQSRNTYCMADQKSSLVVTPSGGLVKCWNEISSPECEVGHLLEPMNERRQANLESWMRRDPFQIECAECLLLPVCMGGCPYLHRKTGQLQCAEWKYQLPGSLLFYYYLRKLRQQAEVAGEFSKLVDKIENQLIEYL